MKKWKRFGKDKMAFGFAYRWPEAGNSNTKLHFGGFRRVALIPMTA
jgi:hypothetical protein